MPKDPLATAAARVIRRLDLLGRVSDERGGTTRTFLSPAMRRANALVGGWMRGAGLTVREDRVGNLIGSLRSPSRQSRTFVLGSHLDTVRDAGRFDGPLGVLLAIEAAGALRRRGAPVPFNLEVVGFSEEEGVRFSKGYIGSKGYAGTLRAADLGARDERGISLGDVLARHNSGRFSLPGPAHPKRNLVGYLEVHIEQGPVLEGKGLCAGVVSSIVGQTRANVLFRGKAGHAGTTPMGMRRDALAGAAEFVLAAEALATGARGMVATVGRLSARPGATNVIAAEAALSLDVRHPSDPRRRSAIARLRGIGRRIARRRGLSFSLEVTQDDNAVACSPGLTAALAASVRRLQGSVPRLPSGAGHDAVVVSAVAPVAMLFVRCRGGLSHHPDEFVAPRDVALALRIVVDFLGRLSPRT
jgi:allantoate deiminase